MNCQVFITLVNTGHESLNVSIFWQENLRNVKRFPLFWRLLVSVKVEIVGHFMPKLPRPYWPCFTTIQNGTKRIFYLSAVSEDFLL